MNYPSKSWCWPKILRFDCTLTIVDFLSNTIDFSHLSNWMNKLVIQGLKLVMSILGDIWGTMKSTWGLINPIFLEKSETLVVGSLLRRRICLINSWSSLSNWRPQWSCVVPLNFPSHFSSYLLVLLGFSFAQGYSRINQTNSPPKQLT